MAAAHYGASEPSVKIYASFRCMLLCEMGEGHPGRGTKSPTVQCLRVGTDSARADGWRAGTVTLLDLNMKQSRFVWLSGPVCDRGQLL
jgi:hypothetical protein